MLEYDDVRLMMFLIERSEYDDYVVADRKAKVLKKMLLIERYVANRKVKVLKKMLLIEAVKVLMMLKTKD